MQQRLADAQTHALDYARDRLEAGRREHDDRGPVVEVAELVASPKRRLAADPALAVAPAPAKREHSGVNEDVPPRVRLAQDVRTLEVAPRPVELTFRFRLSRAQQLGLERRS